MQERLTKEYKEWRKKVLKRDGYRCQHCGAWKKGAKLQVHHIFKWHKYEHLRYDVRNGIVLCKTCHELYDENESIIWQVRYRKLKQKYNKLKEKYNHAKGNR